MDKDKIKGAGKEIKGGIKETAGKVTADHSMRAEGVAEKTAGTMQRKTGEAKDAVREAVKKSHNR